MTQDFIERRLQRRPGLRARFDAEAHKREITAMLRRMRRSAGLTQQQVAERAGWKQPFVAKLESFDGGVPDEATQARFAQACGFELVLMARHKNDPSQSMHIVI